MLENKGKDKKDQPQKTVKRNATVISAAFVNVPSVLNKAEHQKGSKAVADLTNHIHSLVKQEKGVVLKSKGTNITAFFQLSQKAFLSAINIRQSIIDFNNTGGLKVPLSIRIGLYTGEVSISNNNISGTAFKVAPVIQAMGEPGEIYLSESSFNAFQLSASKHVGELSPVFVKTVKVKGDQLKLYRLETAKPQEEDAAGDMAGGADFDFVDFLGEDGSPSENTVVDEIDAKKIMTLDKLDEQMKKKSDLPTFARTMNVFSRMPVNADLDALTVSDLANKVLSDFALTNKLLKLVNTSFYTKRAGKVSTVSQAIMLVGYKQVRNLSLSLTLIEQIQDKRISAELKTLIILSHISGIVGKDIARKIGGINSEEAFICATFGDLGKMLASFYLPKDNRQVVQLSKEKNMDPEDASLETLGISYEDMGAEVARQWNMPDVIIDGMKKLRDRKILKPQTEPEKLKHAATFSKEFCSTLLNDSYDDYKKDDDISNLIKRYEESFVLEKKDINSILNNLLNELDNFSRAFKIRLSEEPFYKSVKKYLHTFYSSNEGKDLDKGISTNAPEDAEPGEESPKYGDYDDTDIIVEGAKLEEADSRLYSDLDEILQKGIYDVMSSLAEKYAINDILQIILEIIYRGMEFFRTIICFRNASTNSMEARFGFAPDIEKMIKEFHFEISEDTDVFNTTLRKNSELIITNINSKEIKDKIPQWYRESVNAQSFVLLPIEINKTPIGLIYGDKIYSKSIVIPKHQLWQLKTLRKQAVLAFKQRL